MVDRLEYKKTYEQRAEDEFEERFDKSRRTRIPFYFRYCLPPSSKGAMVLDIGAGDGVVIQRYATGVGCDIAASYCLKMRKKRIQSVCCDAEHLPFRQNIFDLVIDSAILEHVLDPDHVTSETTRVLRKGGYCFINVPYKEDLGPYNSCKYKYSHLRSFDDNSVQVFHRKGLSEKGQFLHDFSLIVWKIKSPLLNRMVGLVYLFLKRMRLEPFLTRFRIKPFSLSMVFQKS